MFKRISPCTKGWKVYTCKVRKSVQKQVSHVERTINFWQVISADNFVLNSPWHVMPFLSRAVFVNVFSSRTGGSSPLFSRSSFHTVNCEFAISQSGNYSNKRKTKVSFA